MKARLLALAVSIGLTVSAVGLSKKDTNTVEAVDELLTAEDQRHSNAMNQLREGALPR